MTIRTTHSVEMLVDSESTVKELLEAFRQHGTPETAKISIRKELADRPYISDNYYLKIHW